MNQLVQSQLTSDGQCPARGKHEPAGYAREKFSLDEKKTFLIFRDDA